MWRKIMDEIYREFEELFSEEFNDLLIGYPFNKKRMNRIMNLVTFIYYINNAVDSKTAATLVELLK